VNLAEELLTVRGTYVEDSPSGQSIRAILVYVMVVCQPATRNHRWNRVHSNEFFDNPKSLYPQSEWKAGSNKKTKSCKNFNSRDLVSQGLKYSHMWSSVAWEMVTNVSDKYCLQTTLRHVLHCNYSLQNRPTAVRNRRQHIQRKIWIK
jgi:hypothetical protein